MNSFTSARDAAVSYLARGYQPLPVPEGSKNPGFDDWQLFTCTAAEVSQYFSNGGNIGLLLGTPSAGLVDVDLDAPEAVVIAPALLPTTQLVSGRPGSPRSHYWYLVEPPDVRRKEFSYRLPHRDATDTPVMLVEFRATGCQTIVPPSIHPSNEQCLWHAFGEPACVQAFALLRIVQKIAIGALLARFWPPTGARHDAALPIAGLFLSAGWTEEEAAELVFLAAQAAGHQDPKDRKAAAHDTYRKAANGQPTQGIPKLKDYMPAEIVNTLYRWCVESSPNPPPAAGAHEQPSPGKVIVRLAATILETDHFAQDAGGKLFVYSDGVYKPSGQQHILRRVKELLTTWEERNSWSSHRAREVVEYIRIDAPILRERPPLDTINLLNGLLNVETKTLRPHSPDWLSPVQLPISYDPTATCPAWEAFVKETFPEDAQELAYEILADLMTPDRSEQKAILLTGEGGNGKSTYLTAVTNFIGRRNIASLSLQKLETDRFAAARLVGKLANVCPDLPSTHLASTSVFKAVTGGDSIIGEHKYHDSFDFTPYARLIFSANRPPRSSDDSEAFYQRWKVAPFDRTFRGTATEIPRRELDARLADPRELSGVLNHALAVLPALRERGFTESASMRKAWEEFRQATDPLSVWLEAHTIEPPDAMVARSVLMSAYNAACTRDGRAPLTQQAFGRAIRRVRPTLQEAQRTIAGKVTWAWLGIGLKTAEPPPADPPRRDRPQESRAEEESASHNSQVSQDSTIVNYFQSERTEGAAEARNNNIGKPVKPVKPVNEERPGTSDSDGFDWETEQQLDPADESEVFE